MNNTNEQYKQALFRLKYDGKVNNARGLKTLELINYSFILNPMFNVITLKGFETNQSSMKMDFYQCFWEKFVLRFLILRHQFRWHRD